MIVPVSPAVAVPKVAVMVPLVPAVDGLNTVLVPVAGVNALSSVPVTAQLAATSLTKLSSASYPAAYKVNVPSVVIDTAPTTLPLLLAASRIKT